MSKEESTIEMFVGGLVLDPNTQAPVVILKDEEGGINLPIWIGISEATSIASIIKGLQMARPLTHDLMQQIFGLLGASLQRIFITDLVDSTYYAELMLAVGDKALIIDCRPSDAIALALRAEAPIFVSEIVLEKARVTAEAVTPGDGDEAESSTTGGSEGAEEDEGDFLADDVADRMIAEESDFKAIDKDKWNELLKGLDVEDFKHKM
jgi:uncharacterized protein